MLIHSGERGGMAKPNEVACGCVVAPVWVPAILSKGICDPLRVIFVGIPYAALMWLADGEINWEELKHSVFDDPLTLTSARFPAVFARYVIAN